MPTYASKADLDFDLTDVPPLPPFDRVEMASPNRFEVRYAINPHMLDASGALHQVDTELAKSQWNALRDAIMACGVTVTVEPALEDHPDFVFCANPWLPVPAEVTGAQPHCVPSRMASQERASEVARWTKSLESRGWTIAPLTGNATRIEGTGDGLWHPRRQLLWAGVGSRSQRAAWEEVAERYGLRVALLNLADPALYHLDTCLAPLDERTCLWSPSAFDAEGAALIEHLFVDAIAVTQTEAHEFFTCNAFAPDSGDGSRPVLLQRGAQRVVDELTERGFDPVELDTSEFLKAGGSVFCMKMAHPCGMGH
jgi:N-dimethylarginine dimethylaminohydrolase